MPIELSSAAKEWLAERGYDRLYGARPLARVIQEHIKKPLADEILFGKLTKGGHVKVVLKDGKLAFEIEGEDREPGAPVIETPAEEAEVAHHVRRDVARSAALVHLSPDRSPACYFLC